MPKVTFIAHDGTEYPVEAHAGQSLMQAAVFNGVPGIVADCGGNASCGTCHVYIDEPWAEMLPEKNVAERLMVDCIARRTGKSRLSCCIMVKDELEGMQVRLPDSQY